jgi:hypothetical protein
MYWAMFDEMGLINKILSTSASLLSQSAYTLGNKLTNAFNPNLSTGFNSNLNSGAISGASGGGNTYYIGEGAFNVVVKDMTRKECQSVIVEALETL